ncbi:MAG TPA: glycosyltransferase family 39 protein [Gemmataceae bacterium]|nr:glycosyltransferase family 39 protein [Gemmataceae bacterium]
MFGLAIATLVTFSPVLSCGFINFDDQVYVTDNPLVLKGLTWDGLRWSLTTLHFGNWHPLVWWSLQLDADLYGLNATGFHRTNLIWHTGSVLLLFAALRNMTGTTWYSALVAGLFAVHPLNVQSVAWIAERKGVISIFFWVLTLWAYARFAAHPGTRRYLLVFVAFLLGLMAKPMLITLPAILLLLDYWPLRRWLPGSSLSTTNHAQDATNPATFLPAAHLRLIAEKLPLIAVSFVFTLIAFQAQGALGVLPSTNELSLAARVKNALTSTCWYLERALFPTHLTAFYPSRGETVPGWRAAIATGLLIVLTMLATVLRRRAPAAFVGWLWYLIALVPVCGLVQVGLQIRADRWSYVPLIGIFLAWAWGFTALGQRWQHPRLLRGVSLLFLIWLAVTSWTNAHY